MKHILKHIFFSLGIGYLIEMLQVFLDSTYVITFLNENLPSILIALLAINSATLGIVLTKIRDLMDKHDCYSGFLRTKKEMQLSIVEQITLVVLSLIFLLAYNSRVVTNISNVAELLRVFIIACLIYALTILYDTAKSVFVILDYKKD